MPEPWERRGFKRTDDNGNSFRGSPNRGRGVNPRQWENDPPAVSALKLVSLDLTIKHLRFRAPSTLLDTTASPFQEYVCPQVTTFFENAINEMLDGVFISNAWERLDTGWWHAQTNDGGDVVATDTPLSHAGWTTTPDTLWDGDPGTPATYEVFSVNNTTGGSSAFGVLPTVTYLPDATGVTIRIRPEGAISGLFGAPGSNQYQEDEPDKLTPADLVLFTPGRTIPAVGNGNNGKPLCVIPFGSDGIEIVRPEDDPLELPIESLFVPWYEIRMERV